MALDAPRICARLVHTHVEPLCILGAHPLAFYANPPIHARQFVRCPPDDLPAYAPAEEEAEQEAAGEQEAADDERDHRAHADDAREEGRRLRAARPPPDGPQPPRRAHAVRHSWEVRAKESTEWLLVLRRAAVAQPPEAPAAERGANGPSVTGQSTAGAHTAGAHSLGVSIRPRWAPHLCLSVPALWHPQPRQRK